MSKPYDLDLVCFHNELLLQLHPLPPYLTRQTAEKKKKKKNQYVICIKMLSWRPVKFFLVLFRLYLRIVLQNEPKGQRCRKVLIREIQ